MCQAGRICLVSTSGPDAVEQGRAETPGGAVAADRDGSPRSSVAARWTREGMPTRPSSGMRTGRTMPASGPQVHTMRPRLRSLRTDHRSRPGSTMVGAGRCPDFPRTSRGSVCGRPASAARGPAGQRDASRMNLNCPATRHSGTPDRWAKAAYRRVGPCRPGGRRPVGCPDDASLMPEPLDPLAGTAIHLLTSWSGASSPWR
jgi:hypothetical protein